MRLAERKISLQLSLSLSQLISGVSPWGQRCGAQIQHPPQGPPAVSHISLTPLALPPCAGCPGCPARHPHGTGLWWAQGGDATSPSKGTAKPNCPQELGQDLTGSTPLSSTLLPPWPWWPILRLTSAAGSSPDKHQEQFLHRHLANRDTRGL